LRNIFLITNRDFPAHIHLLRKKLTYARAVGAEILDRNFAAIVLNSLLSTWDSIVATVFENNFSSDIIAKLEAWWLRVYKNHSQDISKGITTFHTSNLQHCDQSQLVCTNPKCNCHGHMIDVCY